MTCGRRRAGRPQPPTKRRSPPADLTVPGLPSRAGRPRPQQAIRGASPGPPQQATLLSEVENGGPPRAGPYGRCWQPLHRSRSPTAKTGMTVLTLGKAAATTSSPHVLHGATTQRFTSSQTSWIHACSPVRLPSAGAVAGCRCPSTLPPLLIRTGASCATIAGDGFAAGVPSRKLADPHLPTDGTATPC